MSGGVVVTVLLALRPEAVDGFAAALPGIFEVTATRPGFRSIRAHRNQADPNKLMLVEEWDSVEHYREYIAWRSSRGEGPEGLEPMLTAPLQADVWDQRVT